MLRYRIEVEILPAYRGQVTPAQIERVLIAVMDAEGASHNTGIWTRVTNDDEVAELNATYRGIEGPTDVLSFPASADAGFIVAPDVPPELGDIVISWPRVVEQAADEGHSAAEELTLLLVHGCLHLFGYDHMEPEQKRRMWARQDEILAGLGSHVRVD